MPELRVSVRIRVLLNFFLLGQIAIGVPSIVAAEVTREPFDSRFSVSVGGFFTDHDTNVQLDTTGGPGAYVNLEDDLGLSSKTDILRIDAFWHFAERHRIHFATFDLSQDGSRVLATDLLIDGELYVVDEIVATDWDLTLYEIGYSYALIGRARFQWWLNAALFIQDTSISVTALDGDVSAEDVVLPLPKLGTAIEYAFTRRWIGRAGIDVFKLEVDNFGGSLIDFRTTLDYRFTDHFSLGVGWQYIDIEADLDKSRSGWRGELDWETHGWMIYGGLEW